MYNGKGRKEMFMLYILEKVRKTYKNNNEDNLILLCPNCHSLTSTYKGANLNHGRKSRKKYYIDKENQNAK